MYIQLYVGIRLQKRHTKETHKRDYKRDSFVSLFCESLLSKVTYTHSKEFWNLGLGLFCESL